MSLAYHFGFDAALLGGLSMSFTDDGGAHSLSFDEETFAHIDLSAVTGTGTYVEFATALQAELNSVSSLYGVAFNASNGYTIEYGGAVLSIDLTGTDAQVNMRRVLGFTGDRTGDTTYTSQVRPWYFIVPAIDGVTKPSDERQPAGISTGGVSDGAATCQRARDLAEVWSDWDQAGEDMRDAGGTAFAAGTRVYTRQATAAVPWTYQDAWHHMKAHGDPFAVKHSVTGTTVHRLRADGRSFKPARVGGVDIDIWNIPFRTREIGRLA